MSLMLEDIMNKEAIFCDETPFFRYPKDPSWRDNILLRIRTLKDSAVKVEVVMNGKSLEMEKEKSTTTFDYYKIKLLPVLKESKYYFIVHTKYRIFYYTKKGADITYKENADFNLIVDFKVPKWSVGCVMYQIYIDRFNNGDKTNNVLQNEYEYLGKNVNFIPDWNAPVGKEDFRNFYGGDLQGIIDKIDYLKNLGVGALYLNPVFVSPSNHKYDIQDYHHIDPHIGKIIEDDTCLTNETYSIRTTNNKNLIASDELFIELVRKAHNAGMKVILDGVFNHCGEFTKWLDKRNLYKEKNGAYGNVNSKYRNYFHWKDENHYIGWWDHDNHPKLNFEGSKELFEEIMDVAKKWVSPPFDADGWRLDVGADLGMSEDYNHYFWKEFRKTVKEAKSDSIILAEHYGDPSSWLHGDQWDTVMNYDAFMEPISYFLTGMEKHSEHFNKYLLNNGTVFVETMIDKMSIMPFQALITSMNQISNHDHSRFLTRTNQKCGRVENLGAKAAEEDVCMHTMRLGVLMQMTWIGCPTVYYGDEAGVCGFTDPDNRRTYPWGREDVSLILFHKDLIKIRNAYEAFSLGSTMFLHEEYGIVVYARFNEKEKIIIAINNRWNDVRMNIPAWKLDVEDNEKFIRVFETCNKGFTTAKKEKICKNGYLNIHLNKKCGVILINESANNL